MVDNYTKEDIEQINTLGILLNPKFKELFHIDNLPETENILVSKKDGIITGFIHYSKIYECIEIQNIIVDKKWRNQGFASNLLKTLIENNKDTTKMILEVNENNKEALALYKKHGFNEINRRPKYYKDGDAIIMEMIL
ncbi:MAG: GNAT family N-acetyltransferase [bacterium]|nr:GNAT family N-acetyltransferase [bacterium]